MKLIGLCPKKSLSGQLLLGLLATSVGLMVAGTFVLVREAMVATRILPASPTMQPLPAVHVAPPERRGAYPLQNPRPFRAVKEGPSGFLCFTDPGPFLRPTGPQRPNYAFLPLGQSGALSDIDLARWLKACSAQGGLDCALQRDGALGLVMRWSHDTGRN